MEETTFMLPKDIDDMEEGQPLPNATYGLRLTKASIQPNKAAQTDPSSEYAGKNIVLEFETYGEADESFNGRPFMTYLSLPTERDVSRKTKQGQPMVDFKAMRINSVLEVLGAPIQGREIALPQVGATCKAQIAQQVSQNNPDFVFNVIVGDIMPD